MLQSKAVKIAVAFLLMTIGWGILMLGFWVFPFLIKGMNAQYGEHLPLSARLATFATLMVLVFAGTFLMFQMGRQIARLSRKPKPSAETESSR